MIFDPTLGKRIAPAWQAALTVLADTDWHHRRDVIEAMLAGSDLKVSTCSNVLRYAVRDGLLVQEGDWHRKDDDQRYLRLPVSLESPGRT